MEIFCLHEFKTYYDKLCKNNSYSDLPNGLIKFFFEKKFDECLLGTNLNQSDIAPFFKKDITGRGGFRLYFLALKKYQRMYLGYVHPKTGSMGAPNTTSEFRSELQKQIHDAIVSKNYLKVEITKKSIVFKELFTDASS